MPWRLLLAAVGIVIAAILLFNVTVGFSSTSAVKSSTVTNSHVVGTPDSVDRGAVAPSTGSVPERCYANRPC
jgi:hypothetical protein